LYNVKIRYPQSVAIFELQEQGDYLYRVIRNQTTRRTVTISGETRDSLIIPAGSEVVFLLQPAQPSELRFGYASKCNSGTNCNMHLRVDANSFILSHTLLSSNLTGVDSWQDARFDLTRSNQERTELRFHATGNDGVILISNPIVSEQ